MKAKTGVRETGISRRLFFQGWCRRGLCAWKGPERDAKFVAAFDVAQHEMDRHGGKTTKDD